MGLFVGLVNLLENFVVCGKFSFVVCDMTGLLVDVSPKRVVVVNFTKEVVLCSLGKEIEYLNHEVNGDVVVRE